MCKMESRNKQIYYQQIKPLETQKFDLGIMTDVPNALTGLVHSQIC